MATHSSSALPVTKRLIMSAVILGALPITLSLYAAETSVTIYSSAAPGSLTPANFRNQNNGGAIPGWSSCK